MLVIVSLLLKLVRLRPSNQVMCLPAPCIAIALLVVCWRRRPSECQANCKVGMEVDLGLCPQNWLSRPRPLRDRKKITPAHASAAKVLSTIQISRRPVDVEKIWLTEKSLKYF